jgi:ribbon-helix-helix protein
VAPATGQLFDRSHIATYGKCVSRKKISTTVYITPEQDALLKRLHGRTRVPVAEYIREGIDLVLARYRDQLPGQAELFVAEREPRTEAD